MRTQRKPLGAKGENQQQIKLNPHLPLMPGLEPSHTGGRQVLSPLPKNYNNIIVPSESNVIQINNK